MRLVIVVLLCACGKNELPPPANDYEAFERRYTADMEFLVEAMRKQGKDISDDMMSTTFRAAYIGPSGMYVDRTRVATLAELDSKRAAILAALDANAKLLPTLHESPSVTFALDKEPASVAITALRLLANRKLYFNRTIEDPEMPLKSTQILCGDLTLRDKPSADKELPQLTIYLDKDKMFVGTSKINEFFVIGDLSTKEHDFDKLKATLHNEKRGAQFAERSDIELGAVAGTSVDVLAALQVACSTGFDDIAVLPRDQLSAVPSL